MKPILSVVLSILFFTVGVLAQTPAQVDVTSLKIDKNRNPEASFSMTVTGLPAPYQSPLSGLGSIVLLRLEESNPNRVGDVFNTSFGQPGNAGNFLEGFHPNGYSNENLRVKFTFVGTSPDIVIYPTILRKRQAVTLVVTATVKGKIELYDGSNLVAVDNDVSLKGTLKVNYVQYLLNSLLNGQIVQKRAFDFKNFTISYAQ